MRSGSLWRGSVWGWEVRGKWLPIVRTIRSSRASDRLQHVSESERASSGVHVGEMEADLETLLEIPVEEERRLSDVRIFRRMQLRSGKSRVSGGVRRQCDE